MDSTPPVAAVIRWKGSTLCVQRGESKLDYISKKWEFPGGKVEAGESHAEALKREIQEKLKLDIQVHEIGEDRASPEQHEDSMHIRLDHFILALCVIAAAFGCSDSQPSADNADMRAVSAPSDTGPGHADAEHTDDGGDMTAEDTHADLDIDQPDAGVPVSLELGPRCAGSAFAACQDTVPLPTEVATVIEYLDPKDEVPGRCDRTDLDEVHALVLPDDPAAYPILIRIAGSGFHGECSACAESRNPYGFTSFGVAIEVPQALDPRGELTVAASVNDPWRVVSGGCGEACPHNCLSEYLEFEPSTCLSSYGMGLGVATDAENPPVAEVLVQLISPRRVDLCCHVACDGQE